MGVENGTNPDGFTWSKPHEWAHNPHNPNNLLDKKDQIGSLFSEIEVLESMIGDGSLVNPNDVTAYINQLFEWVEELGL